MWKVGSGRDNGPRLAGPCRAFKLRDRRREYHDQEGGQTHLEQKHDPGRRLHAGGQVQGHAQAGQEHRDHLEDNAVVASGDEVAGGRPDHSTGAGGGGQLHDTCAPRPRERASTPWPPPRTPVRESKRTPLAVFDRHSRSRRRRGSAQAKRTSPGRVPAAAGSRPRRRGRPTAPAPAALTGGSQPRAAPTVLSLDAPARRGSHGSAPAARRRRQASRSRWRWPRLSNDHRQPSSHGTARQPPASSRRPGGASRSAARAAAHSTAKSRVAPTIADRPVGRGDEPRELHGQEGGEGQGQGEGVVEPAGPEPSGTGGTGRRRRAR